MDDKLAPVQPPSVQLDDFWLDGDEFPPEDVAQVLSLENEDSTSTPLKSLQSDKVLAAIEDKDDAEELDRDEPPPEDAAQVITFEDDGSTPTSLKSLPSDKTLDSIAIEDNNAIEGRGDSFEGDLFEGDIVPDYASIMEAYGPDVVQELEDEGMVLEGDHAEFTVSQAIRGGRWENRVDDVVQIPYEISGFGATDKAFIDNAVREIGDSSKVLKFIPRTSQADYIMVVTGGGCSSYVGRVGGKQDLTLGRGCLNKGTVQHEFLHALGFFHEQSRPDRDSFVRINLGNIEAGKEGNFEKRTNSNSLGSPYDYNSVMHYPKKAFTRNDRDTISAPETIGQRDGADNEDIRQVRLLYQCRSTPRSVAQYEANPCTSDCKCWVGATGCNGDSNTCQGDLVCSARNQCVQPGGEGGGNFQDIRSVEDPNMCLDASGGKTNNGNPIWLYSCNGTPAQMWWHDAQTSYIRSAINPDKCLVGSAGATGKGTDLIINDCFANDARFKFNRYTDGSIRPVSATRQCVGPSRSKAINGNPRIHFWDCYGVDRQQWNWYA